jgi:hypothetical protein
MVLYTKNNPSNTLTNFVLDSGSIQHIVCDRKLFLEGLLQKNTTKISWGNNSIINSVGIGSIAFMYNNTKIILNNCLYIPTFTVNIISVQKIINKGFTVEFKQYEAVVSKNAKILFKATLQNNLYSINLEDKIITNNVLLAKAIKNNKRDNNINYSNWNNKTVQFINLWHMRYSHKNVDTICTLLNVKKLNNFQLNCNICAKAKLTNNISRDITPKPVNYLDKVVIDICGPITPLTHNNYKYIIFFLDAATRHLDFKLLKFKSEAFQAFKDYKTKVENQSNRTIKIIGTDNGLEFVNSRFKEFTTNYGIIHQFSSPYTPEQNCLIERINRTIIETTRALLFNSTMDLKYWGEALETAVYLYNITPHSSIQFKSPFKVLNNRKPSNKNIRIWGSIAYYKDKTTGLKKLEPRARMAILVGFN